MSHCTVSQQNKMISFETTKTSNNFNSHISSFFIGIFIGFCYLTSFNLFSQTTWKLIGLHIYLSSRYIYQSFVFLPGNDMI